MKVNVFFRSPYDYVKDNFRIINFHHLPIDDLSRISYLNIVLLCIYNNAINLRFEAKAIGMPKPEIRWLKQGVEIVQSQEYQIEEIEDGTSILIIPEVYQDDMGDIVFEAYNALGVTSTTAALSVESKFNNIISHYET